MVSLSSATISLIVPAFNEEKNLPLLLERAQKILPKCFAKYEIIIVNDGSTDQTAAVLESWSKSEPALRVIDHPVNLGVGAALKDAFHEAQYEWLFQAPGDNQFDLMEIEKFVGDLDGADIVQGWRMNLEYNWQRKIVSAIYRALLRLLFGLWLKDPTWVKMIRKSVIDNLPVTTSGFFGEIEILIRAQRKGYRFKEVAVHTHQRAHGVSSASGWDRILKTFFELIKFWWKS